MCETLRVLLGSFPKANFEEEPWLSKLQKGLRDIFFSKIGKKQRDPVLKLVASVIDTSDFEWCIPTDKKPCANEKGKFLIDYRQFSVYRSDNVFGRAIVGAGLGQCGFACVVLFHHGKRRGLHGQRALGHARSETARSAVLRPEERLPDGLEVFGCGLSQPQEQSGGAERLSRERFRVRHNPNFSGVVGRGDNGAAG